MSYVVALSIVRGAYPASKRIKLALTRDRLATVNEVERRSVIAAEAMAKSVNVAVSKKEE